VKRWLIAPVRQADGTLTRRVKGTPQGSAISPLWSNLFMHYAFDSWLDRECPSVRFERYCDDAVVHCASEKQAIFVRDSIERRLRQFGLNLHPDKTQIVYCKQEGRDRDYPVTEFTFLGFTFRRRPARLRDGKLKSGFLPAVSKQAMKSMATVIRSWQLGRWTALSFKEIATMINPVVTGSPGAAILLHDVVLTGRLARFCGASPRVWCSWLVVVHAAQREIGGSGDAGFPGEDAVGGEVLDGAGRGAGRGGGR